MRIDLYTRTILTLIMLLLAIIAVKPLFQPVPVLAQPALNGVQLMMGNAALIAVDNHTGDVWAYVSMDYHNTKMIHWGKFVAPGKPFAQ
jgi:hypothetical protein